MKATGMRGARLLFGALWWAGLVGAGFLAAPVPGRAQAPPPGFTVQFAFSGYSVDVHGVQATIKVDLDPYGSPREAPKEVTVDYATSDGTAVAGTDYTAASGTLTFAKGETSKTFTVTILRNPTGLVSRTVLLELRNPSGAALGYPSTTVLEIRDEDNGDVIAVKASHGEPSPANPSGTLDTVLVSLSATVPHPPEEVKGETIDGPKWSRDGPSADSWVLEVEYSRSDPNAFTWATDRSEYHAWVDQSSVSSADGTLNFIAFLPGYYRVTARPYVIYENPRSGQRWEGAGWTTVLLVFFQGAALAPLRREPHPDSAIALNNDWEGLAAPWERFKGWKDRYNAPGTAATRWQYRRRPVANANEGRRRGSSRFSVLEAALRPALPPHSPTSSYASGSGTGPLTGIHPYPEGVPRAGQLGSSSVWVGSSRRQQPRLRWSRESSFSSTPGTSE